ncbi:replicative DNA helicase [Akkermansia sp.]|uniref:replicative DNA helicase n=1 Tax=Akkermansia sp. TaxID=1872421 RepID=UPI0025BD69AD|nr:replicative DNA helicase [Akkermansia sp.]MCC8147966.1 replicative DNA helicase [Akkermansia sp.]
MIDSQTLIDAEKLVLSQAMDGTQTFTDLRDKGITRQTFCDPVHQRIWAALETIAKTGGTVDALNVIAHLEAQDLLDAVGGHAGVVEIATYGALARYKTGAALEMVTEATKKRALLSFASRIAECASDQFKSAEDALDEAERSMSSLRDQCGVKQTETIRGAVETIIENLQWRMKNPGAIKGISSGFRRVDLTLDGLQDGAMIVIAARPGVGKTAALVNILTNICIAGTPVGMFSLEMPQAQLLERILYGMAGINSDDIRRGKPMTTGQQQYFKAAVRKITDAPLHIDDESALTIDKIMARGRRMVREHGVKCIGVDYLQLVRSTSQQARGSREREVSEISAGLKAMAKELNIPVLVLAQLNRDVEKRQGKSQGKPLVSDLRDSGSIEQDADQIIMIHRPWMYNPDKHAPTEAQWIVGKNRFGRLGRIQFRWTAELTKYEEEPNYPTASK